MLWLYWLWIERAAGPKMAYHPKWKAMSNKSKGKRQSHVYQIRIKGHIGPQWRDWFEGLSINLEENGETLLTGLVADQAALHGLLKRVRDLGLPLLSVNPVEPDQTDVSPEYQKGEEK
jgi:hypothetical protein